MKRRPWFCLLGMMFVSHSALADMSHMQHMQDDPLIAMLLIDKLEVRNDEARTKEWEGSLWVGHDRNKLYFYSEGEARDGGEFSSQNDLVYAKAIAPFWDMQIGLAYDKNDDASQTWAQIALSGLAPYYFETRASLLVNTEGNIGFRFDAEYEALLTQQWILTPSLEADIYTQEIPKMRVGSGLSNIEAGLRLRYEIKREFAPYIGVVWEKTFGATRIFEPVDETNLLLGVRIWF